MAIATHKRIDWSSIIDDQSIINISQLIGIACYQLID